MTSNIVTLSERRAGNKKFIHQKFKVKSILSPATDIIKYTTKSLDIRVFMVLKCFHEENEAVSLEHLADILQIENSPEAKVKNIERISEAMATLRLHGLLETEAVASKTLWKAS
jgi:hypothetical protein